MKPYRMLLPLVLALIVLQLVSQSPIHAATHATFSVNTTKDTLDKNPGDGICADKKGKCSLRAAVMEANALGGSNIISVPAKTFSLKIAGTDEENAEKGALDLKANITFKGKGKDSSIIDGGLLDRIMDIHKGKATLTDVQLTRGQVPAGQNGGGILVRAGAKLILKKSLLLANAINGEGFGGGLSNEGTAKVTRSRFDTNAALGGGGVWNTGIMTLDESTFFQNSATAGGGMHNGGTATVKHSTFYTNSATGQGSAIRTAGTLHLVNSTLSGNNSTQGGALSVDGGTANLYNVTVANNYGGGGVMVAAGAVANLRNSLLATNWDYLDVKDCVGTLISQGYNFIGARALDCYLSSNNDLYGFTNSPLASYLDVLADNGGATLTHMLKTSSPAIDGGTPTGCVDEKGAVMTRDQRGSSRPTDGDGLNGARCDIGAFEK